MTESKTIGSVWCSDGDYLNMWVSTADCATSLIGKLFEKYAAYCDSCVLCDKEND